MQLRKYTKTQENLLLRVVYLQLKSAMLSQMPT
jgi:hypothetical protein